MAVESADSVLPRRGRERLWTLARLLFLLSLLTPAYYSGPIWHAGTETVYIGFQALLLLPLVSGAMLLLPLNPPLFTDGWALVMYPALGLLGLVNCFGCLIFLPFHPFRRATRRLFIVSLLLTGAAPLTIVALTVIASNSNDRLLLSPWLWLLGHALFCASLWPPTSKAPALEGDDGPLATDQPRPDAQEDG